MRKRGGGYATSLRVGYVKFWRETNIIKTFQNVDFRRFFNKMGVRTMKIELSMQTYADLAIQIEICL